MRLNAYYYGFDATGVREVDVILCAVACAGKAFHHTDSWNEESAPYDDAIRGSTPVEWIQNAAADAAARLSAMHALRAASDAVIEENHRFRDANELLRRHVHGRGMDDHGHSWERIANEANDRALRAEKERGKASAQLEAMRLRAERAERAQVKLRAIVDVARAVSEDAVAGAEGGAVPGESLVRSAKIDILRRALKELEVST